MKQLILLLFLFLGICFPAFSQVQVPNFLGINITNDFSTWKSSLLQKGFVIIPEKNDDDQSMQSMSSLMFRGKFDGFDCNISLLYEKGGEYVVSYIANIDCRNIEELDKTFETNLNDFLRKYTSYKVKYEDNTVSFNCDVDNDDIIDLSISLCKRYDKVSVNNFESSSVLQIMGVNFKCIELIAKKQVLKNIESPTVLGIEFGSDKSSVMSKLRDRFGYSNVSEENGNVEVENPSLGGFKFKYATFEFQYDKGKTYLSYAAFQTHYTLGQDNDAKSERDYLLSLMRPKYEDSIESYTNEDGFKCYRFGTNPKDYSKSLGLIRLQKGLGKDGVKRLYLHLSYGPINYIDPSSDF